jgi:hypothetical protein
MTSIDPLSMVDDPRKDEFVREHEEKLEHLRTATLLAVNSIFDAAMETAKARQRLNKLVLDSPVFVLARNRPESLPLKYSCVRIDILLEEAVNKCVVEALVKLKDKYRSRVYVPGWEGG